MFSFEAGALFVCVVLAEKANSLAGKFGTIFWFWFFDCPWYNFYVIVQQGQFYLDQVFAYWIQLFDSSWADALVAVIITATLCQVYRYVRFLNVLWFLLLSAESSCRCCLAHDGAFYLAYFSQVFSSCFRLLAKRHKFPDHLRARVEPVCIAFILPVSGYTVLQYLHIFIL